MDRRMNEDREHEEVVVRLIAAGDLERLVKIDAALTGRTRRAWYEGRLRRALSNTDVHVSLAAELDGTLVGAVMGVLNYGEFGLAEPVAVLDTLLVDPAHTGSGVGRALMLQLMRNLGALRVERVRTEVGWDEQRLLGFLAHAGFVPVPRLVLEVGVEESARSLGG